MNSKSLMTVVTIDNDDNPNFDLFTQTEQKQELVLERQIADKAHFAEDAILAFQHVGSGIRGVETAGIGQRSSDEGTLGASELGCSSVEMILGNGIGTIYPLAHLDGVEIDLDDALLGPQQFDKGGEIDFKPLAHPRAARPEEHVLGGLLTDGRGTQLTLLRMFQIADGGMFDGLIVEAVMHHKTGILRGDNGNG